MKKLIAIANTANTTYQFFPDETILTVDTSNDTNPFETIARCGIAIERHFLSGNTPQLWVPNFEYNTVGIIWKTPKEEWYKPLPNMEYLRGDELVFPTLDVNWDISWVVGHPRAIIKFAACCMHMNKEFSVREIQDQSKITQGKLMWLSHRIGLKAYGMNITI